MYRQAQLYVNESIDMNPVETLIASAVNKCGSQSALARELGVTRQQVNFWVTGRQELSPENAVLLADIAGTDPAQAVIDAVIMRNKTGPKAERVRDILGKAVAAGVVGASLLSYSAASQAATKPIADRFTSVYIVSIRKLAGLLSVFRRASRARSYRFAS